MLKALIKKQLLELADNYFRNKKTGKRRSKGASIAMIALYIVLLLFLFGAFFAVAAMMADALVPAGLAWLMFAIMGILSILLGVFGSVFNTYAGLYKAKDNELLLSMPIPPSKILIARMVGVYLTGLLFESLVFLPTIVAYFIIGKPSVLGVANSILLLFILAFFVLALTCFFGWVIALISGKLKNKSFVTVIISLAFFCVYYWFCMNYYDMIQNFIANSAQVSMTIKNSIYPAYLFGTAADGNAVSMILITLIIAAIFALTCFIMSKTFIKIATKKETTAKVVYKEKEAKASKIESALLKKEWKRFSSSATYMLNCSIASFFCIVGAVALFIFSGQLREVLDMIPIDKETVGVMATFAVCLLASMNYITAPSVSLEGKNIWILQTMPVDAYKPLEAKQRLHMLFTIPPAAILSIVLSIVLKIDYSQAIYSVVIVMLYVMLLAGLGLLINLKMPNLTWTNEVIPIKQGLGVGIMLFGGWALSVALGALAFLGMKYMEATMVNVIMIVLLVLANRFITRWLKTKGAAIFAYL